MSGTGVVASRRSTSQSSSNHATPSILQSSMSSNYRRVEIKRSPRTASKRNCRPRNSAQPAVRESRDSRGYRAARTVFVNSQNKKEKLFKSNAKANAKESIRSLMHACISLKFHVPLPFAKEETQTMTRTPALETLSFVSVLMSPSSPGTY